MVEAFVTTARTRSLEALRAASGARWAVESESRAGQALYGLGQEQCRPWRRLGGAHT